MCDSNSLKKSKRKHKTKSLIVSTKSEPNSANADSLSLSAGCDNISLRPRFSFRKFGRGRSSSKTNLHDTNSNSNSTSSIDCASPSSDFKCPIITYNDDDDDLHLRQHIESKWDVNPLIQSSINKRHYGCFFLVFFLPHLIECWKEFWFLSISIWSENFLSEFIVQTFRLNSILSIYWVSSFRAIDYSGKNVYFKVSWL